MTISITVAGIDMSDYLTGTLSIDAEEGRSVVASFSICDAAKRLDHDDLAGGAVLISYSGTLLFTGKVRTSEFDPFTRAFAFQASDIREDARDYGSDWLYSDLFQADLTGTLEFDATDKTLVHGTGTAFLTELRPGQRIFNADDDVYGTPWTGTATADGDAILYNSAASWVEDSLVGRYAYNTDQSGWVGRIRSNTATEVHVTMITGTGWSTGEGYRISPGFTGAVGVASITSDTELTLEFEYPGTCGSGKAGKRLWGLYFGPVNGDAADPFDMAVKALDAEWAVLEVDKSGDFRISDCQAASTADLTLDADDFLFHSVKLTHHDPDQIRNLVSFDLVEDYQLKWYYQVTNEASAIDETADSILAQLRSASQVGAWQLKQPLYSSQLGSGPPYTFDIRHVAEWVQQKRKLSPMIGYKCAESIARHGLKRENRRITIDYASTPDATTWGVYDTAVTSPVTSFYNRCVNNRTDKPEGFTIENILAGMARSRILESHRLMSVSLELPIYVAASRALTVQGVFPNIEFRGKTTSYTHEYQADSGRAVTRMTVAVVPPLE